MQASKTGHCPNHSSRTYSLQSFISPLERKRCKNGQASLLYKAACYALENGRFTEAGKMAELATYWSERLLGLESQNTIDSTEILGLIHSARGEWGKAESLQERVMVTREGVLGRIHPATLAGIANLASTYSCQGRYKEAGQLQFQLMETIKQVLGPEHPDTLTIMNNLALILRSLGHNKAALQVTGRNIVPNFAARN